MTFLIDDQVGFIEALPDYKERVKSLEGRESSFLVTALLVCDAAGKSFDASDSSIGFPLDILNLLSLATGHPVGAPWIEYRTARGDIVRRVHRHFGAPQFEHGHALFDERLSPNTGYFLTQGLKASTIASRNTRLLVTHAFNAGRVGRSVDEVLLSLIRAFETLAKEEGVASVDLAATLPKIDRERVQNELDRCKKAIREIAAGKTEPSLTSVNRISDRVSGASQKEKMFGMAVGETITQLGFHDTSVLSRDFQAAGGESWAELLSKVRGEIIHEGGLDLLSGAYDVEELLRVTWHLHDALLRVLLKRLGSQVEYASPVLPVGSRSLDWVKETFGREELIPH